MSDNVKVIVYENGVPVQLPALPKTERAFRALIDSVPDEVWNEFIASVTAPSGPVDRNE